MERTTDPQPRIADMKLARYLIAAATALFVVFSTGCRTVTPAETRQRAHDRWDRVRAEFKLQRAAQQYDARLFGEAERGATEAVALDPTLVGAYVLLARADLELNKPTSAAQVLETAREAGLDSPELTYMHGVVLEQRGQLQEASDAYKAAMESDPRDIDYVIALAESLVALDRAEEAATLLDESVGRFDDDGSILLLAGDVAVLLGDDEGAIRRYRAALEALGESPTATRELGLLLARTGRYEEAITRLTPLLDETGHEPIDPTVLIALANAYVETGQPLQARKLLRDELDGASEHIAAYAIFAKAALATGDEAEAKRITAAGLRLSPESDELTLLHATALWRLGENEPAEKCLSDYLERRPEDPTGLCLLAEVNRSMGHPDRAAELFRHALDIDPDNFWALRGLEVIEQVSFAEPD